MRRCLTVSTECKTLGIKPEIIVSVNIQTYLRCAWKYRIPCKWEHRLRARTRAQPVALPANDNENVENFNCASHRSVCLTMAASKTTVYHLQQCYSKDENHHYPHIEYAIWTRSRNGVVLCASPHFCWLFSCSVNVVDPVLSSLFYSACVNGEH